MSLIESDEQIKACFAVISCNEIGVSEQFFTSKLLPSLLYSVRENSTGLHVFVEPVFRILSSVVEKPFTMTEFT